MTVRSVGWLLNEDSRDTPFQEETNWAHHSRSDWVSSLRWMKWSRHLAVVERSISLRRNILLARTTLLAWDKTPISESRSRLRQALKPLHLARDSLILSSLSSGRLKVLLTESSLMPRKTMDVAGPTDFDGSMGSPTFAQVSSISCMFWRHSDESGAPNVRKSSI